MKSSRFYLLLLFACLFLACTEGEPRKDAPASLRRTVLVYLGTDNNFAAEASEKIETLKNSWSANCDGNLLVYADAGGRPSLIHIYHSQESGGNVADIIETYPAENSANPQTLTRVLNRVKAYRPASSYGLVVLSHGTGWLPAGMSRPVPELRSIILDTGTNETNNYMELSDFAAAIPYKLDFILFDACFMGSVEVCYELKDKTDYVVASPAEVLSPGFVYSSMMQHLFKPEADLTAVAREFYEYYNNLTGLYRSATVSVVKTAALDELAAVFRSIKAVNKPFNEQVAIQNYGYGDQKIYFDLGDYAKWLSPERYGEFRVALDSCIVYKACTDSYYSEGVQVLKPIRAFSGLSVYVPQEIYVWANEAYCKLKIEN